MKNHLETCFILTQFNVYSNSKVNFNLLSNYFGDAANLACGRLIKSPETEHDKAVIEWLLRRLETVRPAAGEREKAMSAYEKYRQRILNNIGKDAFVGAITIFDDNYPAILREIPAPPLVIYAAGAGYDKKADSLAVVGTRKPSTYALGQCKKFCGELSELKINIVSGLAAGIDSCAHKAALDGANTTFAVLGSGFDIIFPPSNLSLYENIIKKGAVISEYLPGSAPAKYTFIFRNRIISGLAKGVLVAAAGEKSGALITAKYASEQNREVFSLCGDMTRGDFGGCHNIIKNHNAKLVTNIADILDEADFKAASNILKKSKKIVNLSALNADENLVYKVISSLEKNFEGGQAPIDNIFEEINGRLDNSAVLVILSKLEIEGFINTFFGKRYETVK